MVRGVCHKIFCKQSETSSALKKKVQQFFRNQNPDSQFLILYSSINQFF